MMPIIRNHVCWVSSRKRIRRYTLPLEQFPENRKPVNVKLVLAKYSIECLCRRGKVSRKKSDRNSLVKPNISAHGAGDARPLTVRQILFHFKVLLLKLLICVASLHAQTVHPILTC